MRDDKKLINLLKTAAGQIEGIEKMLVEKKYCIDISNQIMACQAILGKVNREVPKAHLYGCVNDAAGEAKEEKLNELAALFDKVVK